MSRFSLFIHSFLSVSFLWLAGCSQDSFAPGSSTMSRDIVEGLPNWATPEELQLKDKVVRKLVRGPTPTGDFRLFAEYEPMSAIAITWTTHTSVLREIATAVAAAGAEVWAIGGPSSISGVPASSYRALDFDYDTVWIRDYGPFGIAEQTKELAIVDTTYRHYYSRVHDDAIPCKLAGYANAKCYSTALILDGGNMMTDGQGNLFTTRRIYNWNASLSQAQVDQLLRDNFNAKQIHLFDYAGAPGEPADGTGHIDMFAKLLAPCKVLVAQATEEPFKSTCDAAAAYFASLDCTTASGAVQKYEVYRVSGWESDGTWYTYTNSLIVNNSVIIPSYSGADNEAARAVYQKALPGYEVVLVKSDAPIVQGGSVHCITREIPAAAVANQPPVSEAGPDQVVKAGTVVTLDGSASHDVNNDALTYKWTQTDGPTVQLTDADGVKATFTAPQAAGTITLTFQLEVSDGQSSTADTVNVVIKDEVPPVEIVAESKDTPIAIPDSDAIGITSTINISDVGTVQALSVDVDITHPWNGAVKIVFTCPGGQSVVLHDRTGTGGRDIKTTYTVTACDGSALQGDYTLNVSDDDGYNDKGKLNGWQLKVKAAL